MSHLLERFLRYVKINTMSSDTSNTVPSTKEQFDLANVLKDELITMGLKDVKLNDKCFLTAYLPSNCSSNLTIGLLAHIDTIPDFSGKNVKPNVIEHYDGNDIKLANGLVIDTKEFSFLPKLKGHTLITTDGNTVLGADDKAGVAIIMDLLDHLVHTHLLHHNIRIAFTPDEEIGTGISHFPIEEFPCDFAYTVDGGTFNEIAYENFNAASALVTIKGKNIHPGSAKGHMINSSLVAMEFEGMLPSNAKPMYTEGYEGFIHLTNISGDVAETKLEYILRDHNIDNLEYFKKLMLYTANYLNNKYQKDLVSIDIKDSYKNMYELIKKDPRSIELATKAIKELGYDVVSSPIRGGTDGAQLTYMGLNCPNLGTGGYNCHGPYELASLDEMNIVKQILIHIVAK